MSMTNRQIDIARHALGLNYRKHSFRNHFVTSKCTDDWPVLMDMVQLGYALRRQGNEITGMGDLFMITDAGKALAVRPGEEA